MGGFIGFIDQNGTKEKEGMIKVMSCKIGYRGRIEDFFEDGDISVALRGGQLAYSGDKNLVIFFDGTLYGSDELKAELSGSSDAETVLRGYEKYGSGIVAKLRGIFSFVIYNKKTRELFGARDHFGVKPLYYYKDAGLFMFGSEIKSFLPYPGFKKELNKAALKMYLIFQYSVMEETFFKNVFRFPQGCFFTYKDGEFKQKRYFEIKYETENRPFSEYADILEKTLEESIKCHTAGENEIGGFLSGGVDSSFIVSAAKPKKTFSVGFDANGFDESMYAKQLSDMLGLENHRKIVSPDEFFDILSSVQYFCDEPYANLSIVPMYYLLQMAAEHVKVALSGEGSDEFFSGYLPFAESRFVGIYSKLPFGFRKLVGRLAKSLPNFRGRATLVKYGQKVEDYYIGQAFIMDDAEANGILSGAYQSEMSYKDVTAPYFAQVENKSDLIKKSYLDLFLWLPNDILLKADRMAAAHSMEVRAPILDKEVFALASKIPKKYLIKTKTTKYIFREVANRIIPKEWAKRKKLGFPVPFRLWLKEQKYYDVIKNAFEQDFVGEFFSREKLLSMLDEHFRGKKNNGRKLYTIYSFLLWYKIYFI